MTTYHRMRIRSGSTPWPSIEAYARAHRCPVCGAEVGEVCDAPRKLPGASHAARASRGIRHYAADVRAAPWPEDREPGRRYDSLGDVDLWPEYGEVPS